MTLRPMARPAGSPQNGTGAASAQVLTKPLTLLAAGASALHVSRAAVSHRLSLIRALFWRRFRQWFWLGQVNADVQASGSLVVEVVDAATGKAVAGHAAEECLPIMGNYVDVPPPPPSYTNCCLTQLPSTSFLTDRRLCAGGSAVARLRRLVVVAVVGAGGAERAAEVPHEGRRRPLLLRIRGGRPMIRGACACGCVSTSSIRSQQPLFSDGRQLTDQCAKFTVEIHPDPRQRTIGRSLKLEPRLLLLRRALPQIAVWDFWHDCARARAEFSLRNHYL